jgi:hypothetical protein
LHGTASQRSPFASQPVRVETIILLLIFFLTLPSLPLPLYPRFPSLRSAMQFQSCFLFLLLVVLSFASPIDCHNWLGSAGRAVMASTYYPFPLKWGNQAHFQVGPNQTFPLEWSTGHGKYIITHRYRHSPADPDARRRVFLLRTRSHTFVRSFRSSNSSISSSNLPH